MTIQSRGQDFAVECCQEAEAMRCFSILIFIIRWQKNALGTRIAINNEIIMAHVRHKKKDILFFMKMQNFHYIVSDTIIECSYLVKS